MSPGTVWGLFVHISPTSKLPWETNLYEICMLIWVQLAV